MVKFSKKEKVHYIAMAVSFIALIFLFKVFVFSDQTQSMSVESSRLFYDIYPRNSDDHWMLNIPNHPIMHGTVYESRVFNRSTHNISDWQMVLKIKQPCYLSSCWNGSVEIHQTTKGKLYIQPPVTLKDKTYEETKKLVVKKFCAPKKPLLIYLNPGDKVIYYPDVDLYSENFIPGYSNSEYHSSLVGFIFYKNETEPMTMDFDFADSYIKYHMQDATIDNAMLYVLSFLMLVWLLILAVQIRVRVFKIAKLRDREQNKKTIEQVMTVFTKFIDAKDIYTGGHSERVASYSRMIAKEAGHDDEFCQKVFYCGLLHDCGKISIADSIMSKTEPLTMEEFRITRAHTMKGYELLKSLSSIPEACQTALYHHERYDGTGFPEHLSGEFIPDTARIVAVADSYDTMNTERNYRKGFSREKIIAELTENKGTQFDPKYVDAFLRLIEKERV